jgi:signal transduction histidine kinase
MGGSPEMFMAVLLLLWLIAVVIFVSDSKNESNRWLGLIVFWVGVGTIQPVIRDIVIPYWISHHNPGSTIFLQGLAAASILLAELFAPYCVLMLCISNTDNLNWLKHKNKLALIALIPIAAMLALFLTNPGVIVMRPGRPLPANAVLWHILMALWAIIYLVAANYFLISAYWTAKNLRLRQERLQLFFIIMPPFILAAYMYYIAPFTGLFYSIPYRLIFLIYIAAVFGYFAVKAFVSALKVTINKQQLTSTMQDTFSGTAMLNHVIKNEVLKIDICMNNLIHYSQINNPNVNELLQTIQAANTHLLALVNRVHNHLQDVTLVEAPADLLEIISQSLKMVGPQLEARNIKITKDYCLEAVRIACDAVHIREVLRNVALNAIEAMEPGGQLHIQIYRKDKRIVLAITDNGVGISKKDLPHIMKPFYSTKNRQQNSGLGLTYCYNVMQKHGGTLEIFSVKDIGTTVFLIFPASKVLAAKIFAANGRSAWHTGT